MIGNSFYFQWEVSLIEWLQSSMGSFGTAAAQVFSEIGGETISLVVLLAILFCYSKEVGKRCSVPILAASLWFPMIKNIILRIRPYMEHESIRWEKNWLPEKDADAMDILQQGFSFPSGHSATAASIYGSLALEMKKKWMWFLGIAVTVLVGFSRFALGVHYPTDVLAGWCVGILAVFAGAALNRKVKKLWVRHAILLAIALPGIFWCSSRDYYSAMGLIIGMTIAFPLEEKISNYQDTRNPFAMVLRVAGAAAIYFVLNKLLKMPFSTEFLDSGKLGANLIRTARYVIISIAMVGLYPKVFPVFEKISFRKKRS